MSGYMDESGHLDVEKYADDTDRLYDEFVDDVLMSEDFRKCKDKGKDGTCLLHGKSRCWHVWKCPKGLRRGR